MLNAFNTGSAIKFLDSHLGLNIVCASKTITSEKCARNHVNLRREGGYISVPLLEKNNDEAHSSLYRNFRAICLW